MANDISKLDDKTIASAVRRFMDGDEDALRAYWEALPSDHEICLENPSEAKKHIRRLVLSTISNRDVPES